MADVEITEQQFSVTINETSAGEIIVTEPGEAPSTVEITEEQPEVAINDTEVTVTVTEETPTIVIADTETPVEVTEETVSIISVAAVGPQGAPGAGDKNYLHDQASPASTWVVVHNLAKYPAVQVTDSSGKIVEGEITHDSVNQATIVFNTSFSGKAVLN